MGSQLRRLCREGTDGGVGIGTGMAFSGVVSGGGRPWISDMVGEGGSEEILGSCEGLK
jgi:hypothetical protein